MCQTLQTGAQDLLTWADMFKLLAGFVFSLVLIWAKHAGEQMFRLNTLKRSAWNIAKYHTNFQQWLDDLNETAKYAKEGSVWISAVDLSEHYSTIVAELAKIDSTHSDVYVNYLSAENVVRKGYAHLATLKTELIKARTTVPSSATEAVSLKGGIVAQCLAIKKDLRIMAQEELELLKLIEICKSDTVNPITQLQNSISKLDNEIN